MNNRDRRVAIPAIVLVCGGAGIAFGSVDAIRLTMIAAAGIALLATVCRPPRGLLSPTGPLLLAILTSGLFPAFLGLYTGTPRFGISEADYLRVSIGALTFVTCAGLVYMVKASNRPVRRSAPAVSPEPWFRRAVWAWLLMVALAVAGLYQGARIGGGVGGYIEGLANRRVLLTGSAWITWVLIGPSVASLVALASSPGDAGTVSPRRRVYMLVIVVVSLACLFFTGNRMNLVAYIFELCVVFNFCVRRLSLRNKVAPVVLAGVVVLGLPSVLRSPSGDPTFKVRTLRASIEEIGEQGPISDFGQLAGGALVMSRSSGSDWQLGRTYAAALTMPIPRVLAPWKLQDAGEVATRTHLPAFWSRQGTGFQTSAVGEAFMNFGWPGVAVAGVVFGYALNRLQRLLFRKELWAVLVYAVLLPRSALYFRSGFANVTGFVVMELVILFVCWRIVAKSRATAPRPSLQATARPSGSRDPWLRVAVGSPERSGGSVGTPRV